MPSRTVGVSEWGEWESVGYHSRRVREGSECGARNASTLPERGESRARNASTSQVWARGGGEREGGEGGAETVHTLVSVNGASGGVEMGATVVVVYVVSRVPSGEFTRPKSCEWVGTPTRSLGEAAAVQRPAAYRGDLRRLTTARHNLSRTFTSYCAM
eukprot:5959418-Prymnesium_polylepis.1